MTIRRLLLVAALGVASLAAPAPGQQPTPAEMNRIFLAGPIQLCAVELDGTLAWCVPHGAWPGHVSGLAFDGHGYVWLAAAYQGVPSILRFTMQGTLDLVHTFPASGFAFTLMPAVDRDGNCYFAAAIANLQAPLGWESHLLKMDPSGSVVWEVDLTPQLTLSSPGDGRIFDVKIDEDGNIWTTLADSPGAYQGGRLIKLDPAGNILVSVEAGGVSVQLNVDRTLRIQRTTFGGCWMCVARYAFDGTLLEEQPFASPFPGEMLSHASGARYRLEWNTGSYFGPRRDGSNAPFRGLGYGRYLYPSVGFLSNSLPASGVGYGTHYWALDGLGRVWTFSSSTAPWQQRQSYAVRYGPPNAIGIHTIEALAPLGGPVPIGVVLPGNWGRTFTGYAWALNVDPWGDLDGDGVMNRNELMGGTNPMDPASAPAAVTATGFSPGQVAALQIQAPTGAGLAYTSVLAFSPGVLRLADHRAFAPSPLDPVASWWMSPANPLVGAGVGVLDASGQATITVPIPNLPSLVGVDLHFGFATFHPAWSLGLQTLFGPVRFTVQ